MLSFMSFDLVKKKKSHFEGPPFQIQCVAQFTDGQSPAAIVYLWESPPSWSLGPARISFHYSGQYVIQVCSSLHSSRSEHRHGATIKYQEWMRRLQRSVLGPKWWPMHYPGMHARYAPPWARMVPRMTETGGGEWIITYWLNADIDLFS